MPRLTAQRNGRSVAITVHSALYERTRTTCTALSQGHRSANAQTLIRYTARLSLHRTAVPVPRVTGHEPPRSACSAFGRLFPAQCPVLAQGGFRLCGGDGLYPVCIRSAGDQQAIQGLSDVFHCSGCSGRHRSTLNVCARWERTQPAATRGSGEADRASMCLACYRVTAWFARPVDGYGRVNRRQRRSVDECDKTTGQFNSLSWLEHGAGLSCRFGDETVPCAMHIYTHCCSGGLAVDCGTWWARLAHGR